MATYKQGLNKDMVKHGSDRTCLRPSDLLCVFKRNQKAQPVAERHSRINAFCSSANFNALLAGLLLLVFCETATADRLNDLGRLFTDVSQREMLEAVRHGAYVDDADQGSAVSSVTVNGVMMRSDGDTVIWINGKSSLESNPANGVKVYPDSVDSLTYKVPLNVDGKSVKIKPGQTWSDGAGYVKDDY